MNALDELFTQSMMLDTFGALSEADLCTRGAGGQVGAGTKPITTMKSNARFSEQPGSCAMRPSQNDSRQFRKAFEEGERRLRAPLLLLAGLTLGMQPGCSGGETLTPAHYSPDEAAKQIMADYDTNRDGFLDAKELERCPSLKHSLEFIDQNGDKRLSAEEIAARIQIYADSQVAIKATGCHVTLDGKPLQGATVTYVPEKFMGPSLRRASGVSDQNGSVNLKVDGENLPGVQPGFYRVEISKKNASGQESIPARYNQDTTLGTEVNPHKARKLGVKEPLHGDFRLTSKK
jgi:hypothetical protein